MRLKTLLLCLVPSLLAAPCFAVETDLTSGGDVYTAVTTAHSGDVISLGAGNYTVSSVMVIPSGVTLKGASPDSTHLTFSVAGADDSLYAMKLAPNATGVTITNLDLVSNHGLLSMGDGAGFSAIHITQNNIQTGGGESTGGILVFGISGTVAINDLQITHNYFHDSPSTARNWTVWFASNSNFDYNIFYNINDGGQICSPLANVSFSDNLGTYIHRMGQEVSLQSTSNPFTCNGNVFYDYVHPYYDTEGVSVVGPAGTVYIESNFFEANIAPGSTWGQADSGGVNRFGYAIECTGQPSTVSNNTIVGTWAELISSDIPNASVTGNTVYGAGLWGDFLGEPGIYGYGSVVASGNTIDRNVGDAPAPPTIANVGPGSTVANATASSPTPPSTTTGSSSSGGTSSGGSSSGGSSSGGTTSTGGTTYAPTPGTNNSIYQITGVSVTVTSSTSVSIKYTSPSSDISSAQVNIISTVGRQNFPSSTVPDPKDPTPSFTISGLHPGWYIDFTVVATGSDGKTYTSKPVTAFLTGNSLAPWQGVLWGGISTLQTNPYIQ